jgi:rhodanese-related sulfurtransferase
MLNFLRSKPDKPQPSLKDLIARVAAGDVVLIDVRERAELQSSGTAKGAIHIPLSLIAMKADQKAPDHDKRLRIDAPVAVFCASGARSGMAVQALHRLGYDATNIGGFAAWVQAGGPVIRV